MTNSTLEKVARALGEADGVVWTEGYVQYRAGDCPPDETTPERYARRARAALQSLRQVDDETVEAMAECIPTDYPLSLRGTLPEAFTAAIDHILTEGGEG